jgi:hypothetical protein
MYGYQSRRVAGLFCSRFANIDGGAGGDVHHHRSHPRLASNVGSIRIDPVFRDEFWRARVWHGRWAPRWRRHRVSSLREWGHVCHGVKRLRGSIAPSHVCRHGLDGCDIIRRDDVCPDCSIRPRDIVEVGALVEKVYALFRGKTRGSSIPYPEANKGFPDLHRW